MLQSSESAVYLVARAGARTSPHASCALASSIACQGMISGVAGHWTPSYARSSPCLIAEPTSAG